MKRGDVIQVAQFENYFDHEQQIKETFWIYARVIQIIDPNTLLVEITHPANREHGLQKVATLGEWRTKADLAQLAVTADKPELRKHYQIQADRLT